MTVEIDDLLSQITKYLNSSLDDVEIYPIQHGMKQKQNVCRIKISDDNYLLKLYDISKPVGKSTFTPCEIEKFILSLLHDKGCQVPQVVWNSNRNNAILLEWCGSHTLDELAQSKAISNLSPILHAALNGLCQIESAIRINTELLTPYIFHYDHNQNLNHILDLGKRTVGYLAKMGKEKFSSSTESRLNTAWSALSKLLLDAEPVLGTLDYQARNIVIRNETPFFIDYGSVGWDWQERRIVQYFNCVGAYSENSNFISLIDRELVVSYAEWVVQNREKCSSDEITARIDGHHLLYYLSVIHKLLGAVARPEEQKNRILIEAWGDTQLRFQRAMNLICHSELSTNSCVTQIREMIRDFHTDS